MVEAPRSTHWIHGSQGPFAAGCRARHAEVVRGRGRDVVPGRLAIPSMRKPASALGLGRGQRLRHAAEMQAVFRGGRRVEGRAFVALWGAADTGRRAGFAVSRQVRGAVERNRVRRRLREAYRREQEAFPAQVNVVLVGRAAVLRLPFEEILAEVRELGRTLRGLGERPGSQGQGRA